MAFIRRMPTTNFRHSKWKVILLQGTISIESTFIGSADPKSSWFARYKYVYNVIKYEHQKCNAFRAQIIHYYLSVIIMELSIFKSKQKRWKTIEKCLMHTSWDFLYSSDRAVKLAAILSIRFWIIDFEIGL